MNPQDPLANLQPLREPELIAWWPLAPGWWLLLVLCLAALAGICWLLWRRYQANAYRRRALQQLEALRLGYLEDSDNARYLAASNALLKSVALRAYPAGEVAARSGSDWADFLNRSLSETARFPPEFVSAAYRRVCPELDLEQIHACAITWIKTHEVSR